MPDSLLDVLDRILDEVDGELSSRSRVVDALLDLRLTAQSIPGVVSHVDALLSDLPGLTTVTNAWWLEQLEAIRNLATAPNPISA